MQLAFFQVGVQPVILKEYPAAELRHGDTYTLELRAVGRTLIAKLDGLEVIRIEDDKRTEGGLAIHVNGQGGMRNIEVLNLDQPATGK